MTSKPKYRILFEPDGREISAETETSIWAAAIEAGVYLGAGCGGTGTCGACQVLIKEGTVENLHPHFLPPAKLACGMHLACQSRPRSNLVVEIPPTSRLGAAVFAREVASVAGGAQLTAQGWSYQPVVKKVFLNLSPPSAHDNRPDLDRLLRGLEDDGNPIRTEVPLDVLRKLGTVLRAGNWQVTATLLLGQDPTKLILLESGDTRASNLSLVFDIGTTAVRGQLLDLRLGTILASATDYNGQINYGADVISRIRHCRKPDGLASLQQAVVTTLNKLIREMLAEAKCPSSQLNHITIAANTVMVHLLLAIDPQPLHLAPYVPTLSEAPCVRGRELGLEVAEHTYVSFLPSVASYVGGDIVAGIIGTGLYQQTEITLYIDIGTNGEIAVGGRDWLVSAAASAGPTFEGGGVRHGMLATNGAIDDFQLSAADEEPSCPTIGQERPRGICGAGLINIAATMFRLGRIDQNGKFNPDIKTSRLRMGEDGREYVLVWGCDTQTGGDIVITETDLNNLIRAKAAIFAGCQTLLGSLGSNFKAVDRVVIAGSFGNRLNIENAITIGLLPDRPRESFIFTGNGALLGARLCSFSTSLFNDAGEVARRITNIELSENSDFMTNYVAALFLPHTNKRELFPSVIWGVSL